MSVRMAAPSDQFYFQLDQLEARRLLSGSGTSADPIMLDGTQDARVSGDFPASGVLWYAIEADTEHTYTLETEAGYPGAILDVIGPNRERLGWRSSGLIFHPPSSAKYLIEIDANGSPGPLQLTIDVVKNDNNDDAAHAAEWDIGTTLQSDLNYDGDTDVFKIHMEEGQTWVFNADVERTIDIMTADGETLAGQSVVLGQEEAPPLTYLRATAPETGDYYLRVRGYLQMWAHQVIGPYQVKAVLAPKEDVCDPQSTDIGPGQTVDGSIDRPGEIDVFNFEARRGMLYTFTISSAGGDKTMHLVSVSGPDSGNLNYSGNNVYINFHFPTRLLKEAQWVAPASGTF